MISWEFYSKRRKTSLETFLKEVKTYEEAVVFFRKREITPPIDLKSHYDGKGREDELSKGPGSSKTSKTTRASKPRNPPAQKNPEPKKSERRQPAKRKQTRRTKSSSVIEAPKEPERVVEDPETKNEKKLYFRKIIKPEKK